MHMRGNKGMVNVIPLPLVIVNVKEEDVGLLVAEKKIQKLRVI